MRARRVSLEKPRAREFQGRVRVDLPRDAFRALGTLTFPNFKAHKAEDWVVFVFEAELGDTEEAGLVPLAADEGELHWDPRGRSSLA